METRMNLRTTCMVLVASIVTLGAGSLLWHSPAGAADATPAAPAAKPYTVKDGNKVDMNTYKGFLYYGDACLRCHGPDGSGSSYAPNLTQVLKRLTKEQVENTIINGKKDVSQSSDLVMPAFGTNSDVVENIDNIYDYLLARSDGALGRGHPEHLEQ